jgi:hypothetical protein
LLTLIRCPQKVSGEIPRNLAHHLNGHGLRRIVALYEYVEGCSHPVITLPACCGALRGIQVVWRRPLKTDATLFHCVASIAGTPAPAA